jgi:ribonuclease HI
LDKFINSNNADAGGYADDVCLAKEGNNPQRIISHSQKAIDTAESWANLEGLTFSPKKTFSVVFTWKQLDTDTLKKLKIGGVNIDYVDEVRYLGMIFDKKLSWKSHIQQQVLICKRNLMAAKSIIGSHWGFNPQRARWMYEAIVRPKLTYGCVNWATPAVMQVKKTKQKVKSVQRLAMLLTSGATRTTPTNALEATMNWLPIALHMEELSLVAEMRICTTVGDIWNGSTRVQRKGRLAELEQTLEAIAPDRHMNDTTNTPFCLNSIDFDFEGKIVNIKTGINVYTDGSKMENDHTGAGWAVTYLDYSIAEEFNYLGTQSSVFQAEVFAINAASIWFLQNTQIKSKRPVYFFSDSESALKAIKCTKTKSKLVLECKQNLRRLCRIKNVHLMWIKGHNDSTGNELADMLAKLGTKPVPGVFPMIPIPMGSIKNEIKTYIIEKWQNSWENVTENHTRNFIPQLRVDKAYRKKIMKLSRPQLKRCVEWLSGHAPLRKHLNDIQAHDLYICRLCETGPETPFHIATECGYFEEKRIQEFEYTPEVNEYTLMNWRQRKRKWELDPYQPTEYLINYIGDLYEQTKLTLIDER